MSVADGLGRPVADGGLARWLSRVAPAGARGEVTVALVSDARMRALNRRFRRRDYATDVLSFPASAPGSRPAGSQPLGDIAIATGVARRQARQLGHAIGTELRVLALHGLLHLLGYDHDDPDDRGRMARTEAQLRREGRLAAGLIERGAGARPARRGTGQRRGTGGRRDAAPTSARTRGQGRARIKA